MAGPKVSIVIPVYNGSDYLAEAIDSALSQTWKNLEVIVVNDGSTDNGATERIAKSYGERIRYISKSNGGVASALNVGIANMSGEYFSWLSHDDLYLPNKIKNQMKLLKRLKDPYQIVAGGYYIIDAQKHLLAVMDFAQLYRSKDLSRPLFPVFHCAVNGCTLLIHKSHFERVGVFNEKLLTTQDYELWFRMLRGNKLRYSRSIQTISREHARQTSITAQQEHEKECTELWCDMFNTLTREECAEISGTEQAFFAEIYNHFVNYTSYTDVAKYLKENHFVDGTAELSSRREATRWQCTINRLRRYVLRYYLRIM